MHTPKVHCKVSRTRRVGSKGRAATCIVSSLGIKEEDPGSVKPATRLPLSVDDTVFLIPPDGVGDLVEADTRIFFFFR